ncbi:MAG: Lrp/AsnC family transcriptional regulator [Anaerolineales bacterium]|nr:Lrp/AsnC family transcriptional regulator [Anaerolineales bacterium]
MEYQYNLLVAEHLDEIDRKIITALREDGRTAFSQIAQQLNVSPGMIRMRYNHMVENGTLKVMAITNPVNVGYKAMAMIGVRCDGSQMMAIAEKITALEEVVYVVLTSGRFDILVEVICRDQAELLRFLTEKLYQIEGIRDTETFINLKILKESYI